MRPMPTKPAMTPADSDAEPIVAGIVVAVPPGSPSSPAKLSGSAPYRRLFASVWASSMEKSPVMRVAWPTGVGSWITGAEMTSESRTMATCRCR